MEWARSSTTTSSGRWTGYRSMLCFDIWLGSVGCIWVGCLPVISFDGCNCSQDCSTRQALEQVKHKLITGPVSQAGRSCIHPHPHPPTSLASGLIGALIPAVTNKGKYCILLVINRGPLLMPYMTHQQNRAFPSKLSRLTSTTLLLGQNSCVAHLPLGITNHHAALISKPFAIRHCRSKPAIRVRRRQWRESPW